MKRMTQNEILEVETGNMIMKATIEVGKKANEDSFFFDNDVEVQVLVDDRSFNHEFGVEYEYSYEITNIQEIVNTIMSEAEYEGEFSHEELNKIASKIYLAIESGQPELSDDEWSLRLDFEI